MILQNLYDKIPSYLMTDQTMDQLNFPSFKENIAEYEMLLKANIVLRRFIDKNQKEER